MANTKTFKTRIKLKYDELSAWNSFSALQGEMLLGYNDDKIYAQVGTGVDGGKSPLWISGSNVDITGYPSNENTITTAQAAIADLDTRINNITGGGIVTSLGGETGAITLDSVSGLYFPDEGDAITKLSIQKAGTSTQGYYGVVKVTAANGLAINNGVISMNVATADAAGAMSSSDFTKLSGIATGAQVNVIETVKVNGSGLTPNGKAVDITITSGETNGTIAVNGVDKAVTGLKSAAFTEANDYQAKFEDGSANIATLTGSTLTLKKVSQSGGAIGNGDTAATLTFASAPTSDNKIVTQSDISGIVGAMVYKGTLGTGGTVTTLPAAGQTKGHVYVVKTEGTYSEKTAQIGDMFVSNGTTWDLIQGNVKVTNHNATLAVGASTASDIATVEGVTITAKVTASADKVTYNTNSNVRAALDSLNTAVGQNSTDIDAVEVRMNTAEGAIDALEALVGTTPVTEQITAKINALDNAGETIASVSDDGVVTLSKTIKQNDGVIDIEATGNTITLAKVATTAAASDISYGSTTVAQAITTLDGKIASNTTEITNLDSKISNLDGSGNIASEADGVVTLSKIITQTNGKIDIASTNNSITLAKVAKTGDVNHLSQGSGNDTYIIFDCGTSAGWPTPEA